MKDLNRQVLDLDQYHRRINLEVSGVPEKKEEKPENIVLEIAQKINPDITANDIDIAHRLGPKREDRERPRPIIVRFNNRRSRNAIYDERRKLKNVTTRDFGFQGRGKIFINENLIASTKELLGEVNKARKSAGFKFLWTHNGRIYVKKNETAFPVIIHGKEDLCKLK